MKDHVSPATLDQKMWKKGALPRCMHGDPSIPIPLTFEQRQAKRKKQKATRQARKKSR